jgi:hypothetical protein
VWVGAARKLPVLDEPRALALAGLLAALAGWLVYGVVQFTFRIPAIVYLAALLAGAAVGLAPPIARRLPRRVLLVVLGVALILLGGRAAQALRRPVSPGYEAGFHRWERQPDGRPARWTRGRAALSVPVRGSAIELAFRAPMHDIAARPQQVRVWLDGRPAAAVTLAAPDWRRLTLPVGQPVGAPVLVEVEPGYTFVPSRVSPSGDHRRLGVMMAEPAWK